MIETLRPVATIVRVFLFPLLVDPVIIKFFLLLFNGGFPELKQTGTRYC
jgi:hypothetical protein